MDNANKTAATQTTYAIARATYDTAIASHRAEVAAMNLDWDADFDAAHDAAEDCRSRHNIDALSNALRIAEEAMLDWALAASLKVATATQAVTAREVSVKGRRHLAIRAKLLDLALRLSA